MELDQELVGRVQHRIAPLRVVQTEEGAFGGVDVEAVEIWATYGDDISLDRIDQMVNLKWIQLLQSGYEKVPVPDIRKRGIRITTTQGVHAAEVAEYVLFGVLYFMREMDHFQALQAKRLWDRTIVGNSLAGRVMLIVGTGAIGREIAKRAEAFGLMTIGVNRSGRAVEGFTKTVAVHHLELALASADIVVSVLPSTPQTRHFWHEGRLQGLKPDAVFINVGRGSTVDTESLLRIVSAGRLRGVVLDVFEQEPLPAGHPLWNAPRTLLTPHMAAKTRQYLPKAVHCLLENFYRYVNDRPLLNELDGCQGD